MHTHYPSWRRYWEYAGGGLADMGAHHFDIAMWALGRDGSGPVEVHPPLVDGAMTGASVVFDDGVRVVHGGRSGATFVGTKGTLAVDRPRIGAEPTKLLEEPLPDDAALLPRAPLPLRRRLRGPREAGRSPHYRAGCFSRCYD